MEFSKLFFINLKPTTISQMPTACTLPILKNVFYKFIININFFKKTFLILFILINLYNITKEQKQIVKVTKSATLHNTKFYIWFLRLTKMESLLTYTYVHLPNIYLYKPIFINLYKILSFKNLFKGTLLLNNFTTLFLKKKWFNLSFKQNTNLKLIQNWIEYYIYCYTFYNFELYLRFFFKLPCLILSIKK